MISYAEKSSSTPSLSDYIITYASTTLKFSRTMRVEVYKGKTTARVSNITAQGMAKPRSPSKSTKQMQKD